MIFGNNGRPSTTDLAKKTSATHIIAESNQNYFKQKIYISHESDVLDSTFHGCKVVIESTANVKGCSFKNCILKKGHYPAVYNNRYSQNEWSKNISLDQQPIKGGVQIDKVWKQLSSDEGDALCDVAYENDFDSFLQLSEKLL